MRRSLFAQFLMVCLTLLLAPQIKPEDEPAGPSPKATAELGTEIEDVHLLRINIEDGCLDFVPQRHVI